MTLIKCEKCGKEDENHAKSMCYACYKKYAWIPKKKICRRCKRERVMHTKGLCGPCYNSVFHIHKVKEYNIRKSHNINYTLYKEITKKCTICGFDKVVDLHHLDSDHKNNSKDNLVGICPNHHKMIHDRRFRGEVLDILKGQGFKVPENLSNDEEYLK